MQLIRKEDLDNEIVDLLYSKQFEESLFTSSCIDIDKRDNRLIFTESTCLLKPSPHFEFNQLSGYENLCVNNYLMQPDKKNTYHNYPVLHSNNEFCSKNHQIFRNHTKRKITVVKNSSIGNLDFLIPDAVPMYLPMNQCNFEQKEEKNCNNNGRF
jgi:hypothetical protein